MSASNLDVKASLCVEAFADDFTRGGVGSHLINRHMALVMSAILFVKTGAPRIVFSTFDAVWALGRQR